MGIITRLTDLFKLKYYSKMKLKYLNLVKAPTAVFNYPVFIRKNRGSPLFYDPDEYRDNL